MFFCKNPKKYLFLHLMATMQQKYTQHFEKTLQSLNEEQLEAVNHIDGPVMVIAGPGTGKTHILAARIGQIRMQTDAHASNILCLTFTEAGATAMRKRLLQLIGPEAHKVHIFTFHGFCNHVIRNHRDLFLADEFELLSDLERIDILRHIMDNLDVNSPLFRSAIPYQYERYLTEVFATMKKENWNATTVCQEIATYIADLPNRETFQYVIKGRKGEPRTSKIREEKEKMERLKAASMLYEQYQSALRQKKRYDYDDMILWVIEAFAKNENLLRNYQEQYLYFLVDEYQDTNGAQNKILAQLITYWELPNVFIVGDDDQAIYEFQGARLQSLKDLYDTYREEIKVVVLKKNYRSTQAILDKSRSLIEGNQQRIINDLKALGVDKHLIAQHPKLQKSRVQPIIVEYPSIVHEYADVVKQIEQLIIKKESLEDVAIIYAENKQATMMMRLLDAKGIAYNTKRPVNILAERIVQQVIQLLRYVEAERTMPMHGEPLLFQLLHFGCWNISSKDLAQLALFLRKHNEAAKKTLFWREAIAENLILAQAEVIDAAAFLRASNIIECLLDESNRISVVELYERVINQTGILRQAIDAPDVINEVQSLHTLFDFLQREKEKNGQFSLSELIDMLGRMEQHRLRLPMSKTISAGKGVLLTTAHSSKGLEFKHVFMIDCNAAAWSDTKKGITKVELPDTLTLTQTTSDSSDESWRRLFYVAMTRAKSHLTISYSLAEKNEAASFISELMDNANVKRIEKSLSIIEAAEASVLLLSGENRVQKIHNQAFIEDRLANFSLSPSSLNTYLDCPLSFYYQHLLRVPSTGSEYFAFGNAMHEALEVFGRLYKKKGELPLPMVLLEAFEEALQRRRGDLLGERFEQRLQQGRTRLAAYYESNIKYWLPQAELELHLRQGTIDGIPVYGNIDRVAYREDGGVDIIDFKTGTYRAEYLRQLDARNPEGGAYRRQLLFYKLMYEQHIQGNRPVHQVILSYLEPDRTGQLPTIAITFGVEEELLFKKLLTTTYVKIQNHEFYEGCGKPRCHWCNFVHQHIAPERFSNPDIENLDDV